MFLNVSPISKNVEEKKHLPCNVSQSAQIPFYDCGALSAETTDPLSGSQSFQVDHF